MIETQTPYNDRAYIVAVRPLELSREKTARRIEETKLLLETLGYKPCGYSICSITNPRSKFLIGPGKAEEICLIAGESDANLIVIDTDLTPAQERNWEKTAGIPVIDRHRVIIEIFASRAATREASLQIELARLEYALPRLKKAWTHLSRQRGGTRGTRGEGEQQLESDRRIVSNRIGILKKELTAVKRTREVKRKKRERVPVPSGAIVGYTNAGKSSLLNALTAADVFIEDKLFATLDPTTRLAPLPSGARVVLTDTVGFIRDLPHDLFEAFKSTLEETVYADFLILLLDASDPEMEQHYHTTLAVLRELEADDKPIIKVFNKVDRRKQLSDLKDGIPISVKTGYNLQKLKEEIDHFVSKQLTKMKYTIPSDRFDIAAMIHRTGRVMEESYDNGTIRITAKVPERTRNILAAYAEKST